MIIPNQNKSHQIITNQDQIMSRSILEAVNLSYQKKDLEIVDYHLDSLHPENVDITYLVRGYQPATLTPNQYFVNLGSGFTFGRFCQNPYGDLLQKRLNLFHLNLGFTDVGSQFFIQHRQLIEQYVNQAKFAIILVMSGISEGNSLVARDDGENSHLRFSGQSITVQEASQELLKNQEIDELKKIVEETRKKWVNNYQQLLSMISVPKILLWFSKRPPEYQEKYHNNQALFSKFPELVNAAMIGELKSYCDQYVECVSKQGSPQLLINRFTKQPLQTNNKKGKSTKNNNYYASPEMHLDAANALEIVCKKYTNLSPATVVNIQHSQQDYLVQGKLLASQGKITEAIELYLKAIDEQSNSPEIYGNLGSLYAQQKQWQTAINYYQKAIEFNPNFAGVYRNLGKVMTQIGAAEAAADYWYQALNLEPSWAKATEHVNLGKTLLSQGKSEQAIVCYRHAIELQPELSEAYEHLGKLLSKQGQIEPAIILYRQALTKNPDNATLQYLLGQSLLIQKQWPAAIEALNKAISCQPDWWEAHHQLGEALHKQQRWQESEIAYRHALEINPEAIESRRHLAQSLLKQKRWQEAINVSRTTLEIDNSLPWAYIHLGSGLTAIDEKVEASKYYQQAGKLRGWEACVTKDYRFSKDWFTNKIPVWERCLKSLMDVDNLNVLEVGTFEGMSTCWLLDQVLTQDSSQITCIDIYDHPPFNSNIIKTGAKDKVIRLLGDSHLLLPTLKGNSYDLVYIDGDHQASHVELDARLCWDLVKVDGIVIFDDYEWQDANNPEEYTKIGIDAFLDDVEGQFEILHQGYHLIIKKI